MHVLISVHEQEKTLTSIFCKTFKRHHNFIKEILAVNLKMLVTLALVFLTTCMHLVYSTDAFIRQAVN